MEQDKKSLQEKQLRMMQIQTGILVCILVLIVAVGAFLAVQLADLGNCLNLVEKQLKALNLDEVNDAVAAMTGAAQELSAVDIQTLNEAILALKSASENLGAVDMAVLNQAITALAGAAENLKNLDLEALNELVGTLRDLASNLQRVTRFFGGS